MVGTFSREVIGQSSTDIWTSQSEWNDDTCDGSKLLPAINFLKGNLYQIKYQWLGFGIVQFGICHPYTGEYVDIHTIRYPNTSTIPSILNPDNPLFGQIIKTGGTDNSSLYTSSMVAFHTGKPYINCRPPYTLYATPSYNKTTPYNILTIRNPIIYNSSSNHNCICIKSINVYNDHVKPAIFVIYSNAVIKNSITWTSVSDDAVIEYNTSNSEINSSYGTKIFSIIVSARGKNKLDKFVPYSLAPGDTLTIAALLLASSSNAKICATISWIPQF